MKGGEAMDHPRQEETAFPDESSPPDESTLRAWEDMCSQVLHELQEGAEIPDALVDSIAELGVMLRSWRSVKDLSLPKPPSPLPHA